MSIPNNPSTQSSAVSSNQTPQDAKSADDRGKMGSIDVSLAEKTQSMKLTEKGEQSTTKTDAPIGERKTDKVPDKMDAKDTTAEAPLENIAPSQPSEEMNKLQDTLESFLEPIRTTFKTAEELRSVGECAKDFYFKGSIDAPKPNPLKPIDMSAVAQGFTYDMPCEVPDGDIDSFISRLVDVKLLNTDSEGFDGGQRLFANPDIAKIATLLHAELMNEK